MFVLRKRLYFIAFFVFVAVTVVIVSVKIAFKSAEEHARESARNLTKEMVVVGRSNTGKPIYGLPRPVLDEREVPERGRNTYQQSTNILQQHPGTGNRSDDGSD